MSTTTHASADASSVPATKPAPTTTISLPPYNFDNSVPPPKLIQTGTDYKAILQSLLDYENWVGAARPQVGLVDNVAAPGSNNERSQKHDAEVLARRQRRFYEIYGGPSALIIASVRADSVSARYSQHLREQLVVAKDGSIVDRRRITKPITSYTVVAVRRQDGRWFLASVDEIKSEVTNP